VVDHYPGAGGLEECTELLFAFTHRLFGAFSLDGDGDLFGDKGEDLLLVLAVSLLVGIILDCQGAQGVAAGLEWCTQPHRRRRSMFGVGSFHHARDYDALTDTLLADAGRAIGEQRAPGLDDVTGETVIDGKGG